MERWLWGAQDQVEAKSMNWKSEELLSNEILQENLGRKQKKKKGWGIRNDSEVILTY